MPTTALAATGIYAALCTFIFVWLANETGKVRRREKVALGDGGNTHLARLMRGMINCAEYMPIFLITLVIAALIGMPVWLVHLFGLSFIVGRAIHASYFIYPGTPIMRRFVGFGMGFVSQTLLAIGLLVHGIWVSVLGG
ncbi:MAG: MAPEG family protein [Pseudomonadota bacterium]